MKNVSLVLSGGGARGIAHIGVIEELENQGFNIHSITGCSMGALIGGIYAVGKLDAFKEWMLNINKLDVFKFIDLTLINNGIVKGDKVFNKLKEFITDVNIEDLNIDYLALATDLASRKEVIFDKGNLLKAIRASVSIPNIFTPVKDGDAILVDGGVINNLPINHAKRIENDILIAVNVNAGIPLLNPKKKEEKEKSSFYRSLSTKFNSKPGKSISNNKKNSLSFFNILNDSYEILRDELVRLSIEKNPPDILIETPRDAFGIYDFYKTNELIEEGKGQTILSINEFNSKLESQTL